MTVFETKQEKEIKILFPLFLITDSWLWAPRLLVEEGHGSWGISLLCTLHQVRIKATFLFPPNSASVFFTRLQRAEKAKISSSGHKLEH